MSVGPSEKGCPLVQNVQWWGEGERAGGRVGRVAEGREKGAGGGRRRKFAELNKTRCLEQTKGSVDIGRIVLF